MSYSGLQYNETTGIDAVTGAVVDIPSALDRTIERRLIAGAAIAAGDVVAFDVTATGSASVLTVTQAAAVATGNPLACGVALEAAAAAGDEISVAVQGYVAAVNCDAGVTAGQPLAAPRNVAGQVMVGLNTDLSPWFGVALKNEAGGVVEAYLYRK
jgi:hypothetical protein